MILPMLMALAAMTGCETMYGRGASEERQRDLLRQELERKQLQQDTAAAQSTIRSLESHMGQIDLRVERLEATSRSSAWASREDVDDLRRSVDALRREIESAKAEHERLRSEIVSGVEGLLKDRFAKASAQQPRRQQMQQLSGYEHKVEAGQSLSTIAHSYGVSVSKIKEANSLKSDVIRVGQILFIPD